MPGFEVNAKCRKCNKPMPVTKLRMDPDMKMMVCPDCIKNKGAASGKQQTAGNENKQAAAKKNLPPDWDREDEVLEKAFKVRQAETEGIEYKKIGTDLVSYKCKCGYLIKYNLRERKPRACPYCGKEIPSVLHKMV